MNVLLAKRTYCREYILLIKRGVSDAFFPFDDNVEAAHKAGITAIIQPGGAMRDQLSIDKCNEYGIAMVFTHMRHFRH